MALGDPIPGVSPGELIRTSWGDAVADEVNNSVKKTGHHTMAGNLTANYFFVDSAQQTTGSAVTRKDYVDTQLGGRVAVAGDTMTGPLLLDSPQSLNAAAAVRYDFVTTNFLQVDGDNWMDGNIIVGANPNDANTAGSFIGNEGQIVTHVTATAGGGVTTANLVLDRTGVTSGQPAADGGRYISFLRHGVQIGSVTIDASVPEVDYNKTSDYRLKNVLGPVDDPLGIINRLQTHRLAWKETGSEFDGFIAHEVQTVVPQAVSGEKDAVLPPDDPNTPGGIDPQQLDATNLIVYLVGAVQELAAKVAALEAA